MTDTSGYFHAAVMPSIENCPMSLVRGCIRPARFFVPLAHGFTLIEVTLVVAMIGVLAAVAVPLYIGSKDRAYVASMKADLHTAAIYEEQYSAENHGQYFSGVATADTPVEGFRASKDITVTLTAANILGSHISEWTAIARHSRSSSACELRTGFIVCSAGNPLTTGFFALN